MIVSNHLLQFFILLSNQKTYIEGSSLLPKLSVSNFKKVSFCLIFNEFYRFIFLKFETPRDCRSDRIYCIRCRPA